MDKMRELTVQLRHNQQDVGEFMKDLDSWTSDIKKQDENLKTMKPGEKAESAYPPVRSREIVEKLKKKRVEDAKKVKQERIKSSDYRKWEKLDVDSMLKEVDDEEREMEEEIQLEVEKLDAKRKAKVATEMKEKGNEHFKNSGYIAAIECYTTGMQADPTNPVFPANRAMAFLKLKRYTETEADCILALSLDPCYTKAYLRRGTARVALGKSSSARKDFMDALRLEPGNPQAKSEIEKLDQLENFGKGQVKNAKPKHNSSDGETCKKSIYVQPVFIPSKLRSKKPLMRVEVQEIGFKELHTKHDTISKEELDSILNRGDGNETNDRKPKMDKEITKPLISVIPKETNPESSIKQNDETILSNVEKQNVETTLSSVGKQNVETTLSSVEKQNVESMLSDVEKQSRETKTSRISPKEIDFTKEEKVLARPRLFVNGMSNEQSPDSPMTEIPPAPTTSFLFQAHVRKLANEPESLYKYVLQISPSHIPTLLKEQLEATTLMPILNCFKNTASYDIVYEYLTQFSRVRRFGMAVLFLSDKEKKATRFLFNQLEDNLPEKRGNVKILSRKYGL